MTISPPYLPTKATYKPTHPDLFLIQFAEGEFNSCLITQKVSYIAFTSIDAESSQGLHEAFSSGTIICPISNTLPGIKAYSTVQVLPDPPISSSQNVETIRHIELNSDLLYVNHSCDPNVAFEVPPNGGKWQVRALKDLKKGEVMTFAYFSTEWFMDQPFRCLCGSSKCLGEITGAQNIDREVLNTYVINQHILDLKAHQALTSKAAKLELTGAPIPVEVVV